MRARRPKSHKGKERTRQADVATAEEAIKHAATRRFRAAQSSRVFGSMPNDGRASSEGSLSLSRGESGEKKWR